MHKKLTALLFVLVLIASACGQKPGVHVAGSQSEGTFAAGSAEGGQALDAEGNPVAGGAGSGTAGGGSTAGGRRTSTRTSGGSGSLPGGPPDRTGVSENQILVGFHAPVTGAASAPLTDIENGIDLLTEYLKERSKTIHGRNVVTLFRDDQYNPSHAVAVCRELVESKKVFLLIGGGGTDQVVACARYAKGKGVPYLSAGVTENELSTFKNYFAFSATYPDQTKPLVSLIKNFDAGSQGGRVYLDRCRDDGSACLNPENPIPPGGYGSTPKVAIIYSDTDGFTDAKDAFIKEFQAKFGSSPIVTSITKFNISQNDATTKMSEYKTNGIDVIFVLTSPTNWLELLNRAAGQEYFPRWVGVGVTKGLDLVANLACNSSRKPAFINSLMFSPWFSVRHPDADQFRTAWREVAGASRGSPDPNDHDLAWGVWGGSIVQATLYHRAGKDLSRQSFIAAMEKMKAVKFPDAQMGIDMKDVYSELNYSPDNHFGAKQVHLLYGHCETLKGYWNYFPGKGHFSTDF